jgi:Tetratricopeptide repeat
MLFDGGSLARTRRRGDNAGMAGDDGRAQVQLDEDTLARRRRDLGEDHPDTLAAASNLAVSLRAAGEYQAARELGEDTLARRRRVLGEDHPDTGASATFAIFLRTPRMLLKTMSWHSRRRRAG